MCVRISAHSAAVLYHETYLFINILIYKRGVSIEYCTYSHDTKKELMVQFCIAYCGVLSKHNLCATGTTGKMVAEATGLNVQRYLSGSQGGDQQIAARISCNEIDLLLFFRDPISVKPHEPNDMISSDFAMYTTFR